MLSESVWNANLLAQFSAISFIGTSVPDLTDALSKGFTNHISGKSFSTTDIGTIGTGVGSGTGIGLNVSSSVITSSIYSSLLSKGFDGSQLLPMCQAIGLANNLSLLNCMLTSNHSLINGSGTVIPSSIEVSSSAMSFEIQNNTTILTGDKFPDFCDGVAEGFVNSIQTVSTGNVIISPVPITAIPISPGSGTGTGIIT